MQKKQIILKNKGMNRDTSVSKVDGSSAFENRNIRIIARDDDTLLTVTNERGTKELNVGVNFPGDLVGWNVLNNHVILFTHIHNSGTIDKIYRVDYVDGEFETTILYTGHLGFEMDHPIESIVHFETDDIQKIYWLDGINPLRFMNFMATAEERENWDDTTFDSNRPASFRIKVDITKDNAGEIRPNGVTQYLVTYFNKHGQETGHVFFSDVIYLSPIDRGGAADETNNNRVILNISNLDTTFTHFRVYSIFRSSLDGQVVAYLVDEQKTTTDVATVIDDGAHLTVQDTSRLLYLGSQSVVAGTLEQKDETLFLGDLESVGRADYDELEAMIKQYMFGEWQDGQIVNVPFVEGETYLSCCVEFRYSNSMPFAYVEDNIYIPDIPYVEDAGTYPYSNQLQLSSSEILTFKGGEKYRFALKFQYANGVETDAFWIGDVENTLYPVIDNNHHVIRRVVAACNLPIEFIAYLKEETPFKSVRLCIAEATYADRSVKAQGIVNPTMFNVWERYNNRLYSVPSWITRVRGGEYPSLHFRGLERSDSSLSEVQCNWWDEDVDHSPFYQYKDYKGADANPTYLYSLGREEDWDMLMLVYRIRYKKENKAGLGGLLDATLGGGGIGSVVVGAATNKVKYKVLIYAIKAKIYHNEIPSVVSDVINCDIKAYDDEENSGNGKKAHKKEFDEFWTAEQNQDTGGQGYYKIIPYDVVDPVSGDTTTVAGAKLMLTTAEVEASTIYNQGGAKNDAYQMVVHALLDMGLDRYAPTAEEFVDWCTAATHARGDHKHRIYVNQNIFTDIEDLESDSYSSMYEAVNDNGTGATPQLADRWIDRGDFSVIGDRGSYAAAYYKKHLMFVDENIVTLDSPELDYNAIAIDKADYKFRIIGMAKMSSVMSDYTIDATHSNVDGMSYDDENFSGTAKSGNKLTGLISWPLWREYALRRSKESLKEEKEDDELSSSDYYLGSRIIRYMLYMWHRNGSITGFTGRTEAKDPTDDEDEEAKNMTVVDNDYSRLNHKVWANLHFSHSTIYLGNDNMVEYVPNDIRMSQEFGASSLNITAGDDNWAYDGNVQFSIGMPGSLKYPIYYSNVHKDTTNESVIADGFFLKSNLPIQLEYGTKTHAVISLGTWNNYPEYIHQGGLIVPTGNFNYRQAILPRLFDEEKVEFELREDDKEILQEDGTTITTDVTGALLPWIQEGLYTNYLYIPNNTITQPTYQATAYSDADIQFQFKATVANTGDGLRYVNIIKNAINYGGMEDMYMTVHIPGYGEGTIDKMVLRIADLNIIERPDDSEYDIVFTDPKSKAWSDGTDAGPGAEEVTLLVQYIVPKNDDSLQFVGTGTLHVWNNTIDANSYAYRDYAVYQPDLHNHGSNYGGMSDEIEEGDQYIFIGEIYAECGEGEDDKRYGGIFEANVKNNRFINAGPAKPVEMLWDGEGPVGGNTYLYANQGDTYFQRWDSFRVKPFSNDAVNQNIDITSVMLETHINIDGRCDRMRGMQELASIDQPQFNTINRVYSQKNNFVVRRDTDSDYNTDAFRSTVTWTLPKHDMADVDEWTHITLASTLKLDGDKGICRSLNRFANRLIAFQDRGISEIYFNAMTQIGTQEGVPIEIANSGKVTGKGYFTNKYGCINKWSIVEGKRALYFVDNINKAFCNVSVGERGQLGAGDISTGKGFSVWFKDKNNLEPWTPEFFQNYVAFFDRVHSDVYLVKNTPDSELEAPCLVYNELLGEFTSFFDYSDVPMIANVEDKLVSFRSRKMWLQNEGTFCNFYGTQYPFWMQYRVTPDPYGDKIWTNLEYRADFYRMVGGSGYTRIDGIEHIEDLDGVECIICASNSLYALATQNGNIHSAEQTGGDLEEDTRVIPDTSTALKVRFDLVDTNIFSIKNITPGDSNYGKYLSWSGSGLSSGKNLTESSREYNWEVSLEDDGTVIIRPYENDQFWIQFNSGSPRFCCYKSAQAPIALFEETGSSIDTGGEHVEQAFTDDLYGMYQPDETFSFVRFWNEYQTTENNESRFVFNPEKKFRIWRYQIPRAKQNNQYNPYGLDRIRNPWVNILLKKSYTTNDQSSKDLMQMHDMSVIYYE